MRRLVVILTIYLTLFGLFSSQVYAQATCPAINGPADCICNRSSQCAADLTCQLQSTTNIYICKALSPEAGVFGKFVPPRAVENLGIGSFGVNNFINIIIRLIFILSTVIFVFMIITSAIQWLLSGGNKEAVTGAQKRLTYAIVGMIVLAIAFAIANLVGQFTGFKFF